MWWSKNDCCASKSVSDVDAIISSFLLFGFSGLDISDKDIKRKELLSSPDPNNKEEIASTFFFLNIFCIVDLAV
jgi:hypothetical protein